MLYFTSDHHFGHRNIIEYCNRPFDSIEEMDKQLIQRWNEVVVENDIVYHLGDFTLAGLSIARRYLKQLNGMIHILGNTWHHDRRWIKHNSSEWITTGMDYCVEVLPPVVVLKPRGSRPAIVLCHYPMAKWDRSHYGSWHLHGHCHGQFNSIGLSIDVGVDAHDFYPISLNKVEQIMKRKRDYKKWNS